MDGLVIMNRHSHHAHSHHAASRVDSRSSQLPIPTLRGRKEAPSDPRRHSVAPSSLASSASDGTIASPSTSGFWDTLGQTQGSVGRQQSLSYSSTYQHGNSNRPSLPSLRTVLGERVRSPPATPLHQAQAHPREPTFDHSMHKPPSLYPNKRTRTDSGWDGHSDRNLGVPSPSSASFLKTYQNESNKSQQQQPPTPTCASPDTYAYRYAAEHVDDRSLHEPQSHYTSPEVRGRTAHTLTSPGLSLPESYEDRDRGHPHHRNHQHSDIDVRMSGARHEAIITQSCSPSLTSAEEQSQRAALGGRSDALQQRFRSDSIRHSVLPATSCPSYRDSYSGMNRLNEATSYNTPSYPYSQAFFVPSHYEYQNGKSRKRSNLPKQSTEIMKRWFDDNLQNPYPSEEQKRHFAAVAGINLTQVSNWFINHRRRCPELREKRDKGRSDGRDDSV